MRLDRAGTLAAWCVAVLLHAVTAAAATCTSIFTPADLDKIRKNLYGSFCLEQDIDLASVSNFRPIGMNSFGVDPFGGKFDGKGHVIRNLTIRSGGVAGFFAAVGGAGTLATVTNIGLVHVNVVSTQGKDTGGLVATMYNSALISDSYVTGSIVGWNFGFLGGLVGTQAGGTIQRSHSSASVTGSGGAYAGGLVGDQGSSGGAKIVQSYATGPVSVSGSGAHVGGLVGDSIGRVIQSSASGPVEVSDGYQNLVGGLVGVTIRDSTCNPVVEQSFATGSVTYNAPGDIYTHVGGLAGMIYPAICTKARETYAVGRITLAHPATTDAGGLVGDCDPLQVTIGASYWDSQTTGLSHSPCGRPKTTAELQSILPTGYGNTIWGVTPHVSFPYLKLAGLDFWSPLAMTAVGSKLFTFLPLSQLEKSEYGMPVTHAANAGLAAVYTIIARAIGITDNAGNLKGVAIDTYFWDDASHTASFSGPITTYASLGGFHAIGPTESIGQANIIGPLKNRRVVIIRGSANLHTYWMLATSFLTDSSGNVVRLVADDVWTGRQVQIDPSTKKVVVPADFPISGFEVNGFQMVTLN